MSEQFFKRSSMVCLGCIGLPTAAMFFFSLKERVVGVDVNRRAVDTINKGQTSIIVLHLDMVFLAAVHRGYLHATTKPTLTETFLITAQPSGEIVDMRGL